MSFPAMGVAVVGSGAVMFLLILAALDELFLDGEGAQGPQPLRSRLLYPLLLCVPAADAYGTLAAGLLMLTAT